MRVGLFRAFDGIKKLMVNASMLAVPASTPSYPAPVLTNDVRVLPAAKGGFTEMYCETMGQVKEGDLLAVQVCVCLKRQGITFRPD